MSAKTSAPPRFPFPFWGHAFSTSDRLAVFVWFADEPTAKERAAIVHELDLAVTFWGQLADDRPGTWRGPVLEHSHFLDKERKHVPATHALVAPVLARLDHSLYGADLDAMSEPHRVGLSFHAGLAQRLLSLHERFPIALAVRESAPRDRFTAWHDWSLGQLPAILPQLQAALTLPVATASHDWLAPWLAALVLLARYQLAKQGGERLADDDRAVFASLLARAAAACVVDPRWPANSAVRSDVEESGRALLAFAGKLTPSSKAAPLSADPEAILAQIAREAAQLEFTRIKLSECPTFVALSKRGASDLQCGVIIAACAQTLRHAERLYGKPGETALCFGAADQQELQVRERLMSQLLRKKVRFSVTQAASLLRLLASSRNAIGAWLPVELLLERLRESVLPALDNPDLKRAHRELLAAPYALHRDNVPTPYKPLVDALLTPAR